MGLDLVMPRLITDDDIAVGTYLRRRLGPAVVDRLAGPLVGGIYGTSIDELSLDAVVPQLREAERTHRSLLLAGLADGRRMRAAAAARAAASRPGSAGSSGGGAVRPLGIFASLRGGLGDLVAALERRLGATSNVTVALGTRVVRLEPAGSDIRAHLSDGRAIRFHAAIVTTPGPAAAGLVAPFSVGAASAIREIPHASSTVVTLAFRDEAFPERPVGHGWLIPRSEGLPISALTFSSSKWADRAPEGHLLLRAFLPGEPGSTRAPDEAISLVRGALMRLMRLSAEPDLVRVASYEDTMPRYTVGHLGRVARAEAELAAHPAVVLAGSPYRGVGLPDCIAGARSAAGTVLSRLGMVEPASA
jgi:protoporphyrinogen/coproporphyrinogen III oxidase